MCVRRRCAFRNEHHALGRRHAQAFERWQPCRGRADPIVHARTRRLNKTQRGWHIASEINQPRRPVSRSAEQRQRTRHNRGSTTALGGPTNSEHSTPPDPARTQRNRRRAINRGKVMATYRPMVPAPTW